MIITPCGRGIHRREIVGVAKLKEQLPPKWYGFTNLEIAVGPGKGREIDVVIIAEDRIFLADLKDWNGRIESDSGHWLQNGNDCGPSPVSKIIQNARDVGTLLSGDLKKRVKEALVPLVQGLVLITGNADWSRIAATEKNSVRHIDDFIKKVSNVKSRVEEYGAVAKVPLTENEWKDRLSKFFNAPNGFIRPGRRRFGRFVAVSENATFQHPTKIYSEYDAVGESANLNLGTIRLWDFTKADNKFLTAEGRAEIAGRERQVISYLRDRNESLETALLTPQDEDNERGVSYWEVYDRRQRLRRLSDFVTAQTGALNREVKIELGRQLLAKVAALHSTGAAHLDLGGHSVWLEAPSNVRLSHLMAAHYPSMNSLGQSRFQFLSCAQLPETIYEEDPGDPRRRDVFLAGVCVHFLLFGKYPPESKIDSLANWDPSTDSNGEFTALHGFFERSLSMEQSARYADATAALDAYNEATFEGRSNREIIEGLERFRIEFKSQKQFFAAFPDAVVLRESDRVDIWESGEGDHRVVVKLWKRAAWGDQVREGSRILDFLERADDFRRSPQSNCARILSVSWLNDAIGLVQEHVDGPLLSDAIKRCSEYFSDTIKALTFVKTLCSVVLALHDSGSAHGDLKPDNIVLFGDDRRPVLIDLIDFSASDEGDRFTPAYAPPAGGRLERDRHAVTRIAEEVLGAWLEEEVGGEIRKAIYACRNNIPANGTLLPLVEAVDAALEPPVSRSKKRLSISLLDGKGGILLPDEGKMYLRRYMGGHNNSVLGFCLRGACEEIRVNFDNQGKAASARRVSIDQKRIRQVAKFEHPVDVEIFVEAVGFNNVSALDEFTGTAEFMEVFAGIARSLPSDDLPTDIETSRPAFDDIEAEEIVESSEAVEDAAPAAVGSLDKPAPVDVAKLWQCLINVERELTTEGVAQSESVYDREMKRHVLSFELERGAFDFNRNDTVGIERLDTRGRWRRVGQLDLRSKPNRILIDATETPNPSQPGLIHDGQRLRFHSHFSKQSLTRRESAISKILAKEARISTLVDLFEGRVAAPSIQTHHIDAVAVDSYGFNKAQRAAFEKLVKVRPLGLLQGPPGTGKTTFIGALAHYALTHGLASNILVASQSHEAVNNVAESVLKLFAKSDEQPSILRVGNEGVVSEPLMPFHTDSLERLYKDRFKAEFRERVRLVGSALGLPDVLVDELFFIETSTRPVLARLAQLESAEVPEEDRIAGLRVTLAKHLLHLGLSDSLFEDMDIDVDQCVDDLVDAAAARFARATRPSPALVARMRAVINLGNDFVWSVSSAQRTFETFLAGTRQIVAGTCVGLGRDSLGLMATPFDLVIVDEAARCTASELAVPMQAGRWIVLLGDQAQLEPQHPNEVVKRVAMETDTPSREILRSDFERLFESTYGKLAGCTLTEQYRMLPPIGSIVSQAFYEGILTPGRQNPEIPPESLPSDLRKPITWFATDGLSDRGHDRREKTGSSRINLAEAEAIAALLKRCSRSASFTSWATKQTRYEHVVGVICMYAAQRDLVRKKIQAFNLPESFRRLIKVDTVDSYQGKQNPVVIVSLVRNNADGPLEEGIKTIRPGFLSRPNRINVAVSRAMDRLVIVGSNGRWKAGTAMGRLVAAVGDALQNDDASLRSVFELLSNDGVTSTQTEGVA
ncbi:AAA family ATPase [Rhodomicrobium sp. Az07]|uniref:AAA domain-containing protein n=1 Tax=Rhodomicrobium sp. Az07 TaxID=2839034 RepID=UPI001BEC39DF|nr:AAA domain-containing protein [Rhodomicrobium sp. Az07]MBT3072035.1 AAA family ATPase [Rhodomicrobium sp. Az07]